MNKLIVLLIGVLLVSCGPKMNVTVTAPCEETGRKIATSFDPQSILNDFVEVGVPGIVLAVSGGEEVDVWSAGLASIENKVAMEACHLVYLQSISKIYMAALTMKLVEKGEIDLDKSITAYLPAKMLHKLPDPEKVTVRMLLNHTSGLPEYNYHPAYVSYLLQHPEYVFDPREYLDYIEGREFDYEPGSRYSYRNINYVLLALIGDAVSGDHALAIREVILNPLELRNTFYRDTPGYLKNPYLVEAYWDRFSNGSIENISSIQKANVAGMVGDDGLVTTAKDAVLFLQGLLNGQLLTPESLKEMQTWVHRENGEDVYGLGLATKTIAGYRAIGHSGGGLGAGCELYYFPEKNLYMFVGINLGTVTYSPLHDGVEKVREELFNALLR